MTAAPILFVSHEGTRTGAPIMLLHFLRWLRHNSTIEPHIALLRGGPLVDAFAELGPTVVLGDTVDWPAHDEHEVRLLEEGRHDEVFAAQQARMRPVVAGLQETRVAYLNSSASLRLLHHLPNVHTAIAHIHELESAFRWSLRREDPSLLHTRVDHFVAAADCVAANLVARHHIDPLAITRVYEFIDAGPVLSPPTDDRASVRARVGIPADALVIGGCGFADWRKGIDLFVQLARTVAASGRDDVHFVWVGDRPGGTDREQLDFDIEHAQVDGRLHLVGLQQHPFDWYRAFDVFALTSREDPYPLVGLETALLEVPMVCFAESGGMTEFVGRSSESADGTAGLVVPYLDVEAMADAIIDLFDHPDRRAAMGARAAAIVRRDHQVTAAAPLLLDVVERVVGRELR